MRENKFRYIDFPLPVQLNKKLIHVKIKRK